MTAHTSIDEWMFKYSDEFIDYKKAKQALFNLLEEELIPAKKSVNPVDHELSVDFILPDVVTPLVNAGFNDAVEELESKLKSIMGVE